MSDLLSAVEIKTMLAGVDTDEADAEFLNAFFALDERAYEAQNDGVAKIKKTCYTIRN